MKLIDGEPICHREDAESVKAEGRRQKAEEEPTPSTVYRLPSTIFARVCWLYVVAVLAVWAAMYWGGDRWWWGTAIIFAPRWGWALPLVLLLPAAMVGWALPTRKSGDGGRCPPYIPLALAVVILAWPVMGLCVPWQAGVRSEKTEGNSKSKIQNPKSLRVLTCNVGQNYYDPLELAALIAETDPHVITIQERMTAEELAPIVGPDWHVVGMPGITVASRFPILNRRVFNGSKASVWRTVAVDYCLDLPDGPVDFVAVHLFTPRKGIEALKDGYWSGIDGMRDNLQRRVRESAAASRWVASLAGPVIVAGDMNMPPESLLFNRDWGKFTDAFAAAGWGYGYTYGYTTSGWLYGARIDHILADAGWRVDRCWVGRHIGSDHRPLLAELGR